MEINAETASPLAAIESLFDQLSRWRNLPAYRLESRVDAFFGLYMREVLGKVFGTELHEVVIPELPLRLGTVDPDSKIGKIGKKGKNQSVKVDFVLFHERLEEVYFVEIKTDTGSRRVCQDEYLVAARTAGLEAILDGILSILRVTNRKYLCKYCHLVREFEKLELLSVPPEFYKKPGIWVKNITATVSKNDVRYRIVYVQPKSEAACPGNYDVVSFDMFRALLPPEDPVAAIFGRYLKDWEDEAGAEVQTG